jgi:alkylated DNA repair dioxygenase AlkB
MALDIDYYDDFLSGKKALKYFEILYKDIKWEEHNIRLFGKLYKQPRLISWYGDSNAVYTYSRTTYKPRPWTKTLLEIKSKIEKKVLVRFNSVLLNLYRNGADGMSWHSDDEAELGKHPVIASLSLGEERKFFFKHKQNGKTYPLQLKSGSLLVMHGSTQEKWKHSLPKTKRNINSRINLTFRNILQ